MTVARRAFHGIAWSAISGWAQLAVSLCTFGVVAHRLSPAEIGSFGAVTLLLGLAEVMTSAPLGDGLQQRKTLDQIQIDATFWVGLMVATGIALLVAAMAEPIATAFSAPLAQKLAPWAALGLPIGAATTVPSAMLSRELRFDVVARACTVASIASGGVAVAALLIGLGVWSLLLADMAGRLIRLGWFWTAARYRPSRPRELGAIAATMRFNVGSAAIYALGQADRTLPRLLAGLLLGAGPLGYLMIAQRVLDLLNQLVLSPLNSVTMVVVARVQDDPAEVRRLVLRLYRLAALCAYPVFLGAIVVTPDLARLIGDKWLPAVAATQILLLVGLRMATGVFNIAIFRGMGDNLTPSILLGGGLAINLLLVPVGAAFGVNGVAASVLLRVLVTWPLGCWFIRQATGLSFRDQAAAGSTSLMAAMLMAVATAMFASATPGLAPIERLVACAVLGGILYGTAMMLLERDLRLAVAQAWRLMVQGESLQALRNLRASISA